MLSIIKNELSLTALYLFLSVCVIFILIHVCIILSPIASFFSVCVIFILIFVCIILYPIASVFSCPTFPHGNLLKDSRIPLTLCSSGYCHYLLMVILKGTWEYLMTISGGLKYLTEEISFRKNNLHHLTPHVRISHIPHI